MSFLNSKEEVLDIQLTPYGKFLYSQGKLKPTYYAFFDDDIIYDNQYASVTESQNSIEPRIQEETPYTMCLANNFPAETNLRKSFDVINPNIDNQLFTFTKILGTSDLDYNYGASWDIKLVKGTITSFNTSFTGSNQQRISIPQINTSVVYETSINKVNIDRTDDRVPITPEELSAAELGSGMVDDTTTNIDSIIKHARENNNYNTFNISGRFEDGTAILVEEKSVIIDISEKNTQLINDMYEIEVFRYDKDSTGNDTLTKLFFRHEKPSIVNNILLDDQEQNDIEITRDFVEYYFNVFVDNQIDNQIVCDYIQPTQKGRNTMVTVVSCDETTSQQITNNLYDTNAKVGGTC
jgi:hypothetical protein